MAQFLGPLPPGNLMAGRAGHSMKFDQQRQITAIVMHTIGGNLASADAEYKDASSHLSSHYGVGLEGSVVQWVTESDTAYHADNWSVDVTSIGIQHEDDGHDGPRSDQLYQASSRLVRQLCLSYGIPISTRYVVRHSTIAGPGTMCPGGLDVDRIVAMASGVWTPPAGAAVATQSPLVREAASEPAAPASPPAGAVAPDGTADSPSPSQGSAQPPPPAAEAHPIALAGQPLAATIPTTAEAVPAPTIAAAPVEAATAPPMTGDPLRDIAALLYGEQGHRQDIYDAIKGVVNDAPVLIQLEKMLSAAVPPSDTTSNGPGADATATMKPAAAQPGTTPPTVPTGPAQPAPITATTQAGAGGSDGGDKGYWGGSTAAVFAVQIFYLTVLAGLAIDYFTNRSSISLPDTIGPLSIAVPWYGALGAVLISLVGVTQHRRDWDPSYRFWHWARPFLGASFASISVLIFQAGILAVGSSPQGTTGTAGAIPKDLLYYLAAFVVGYREETFRELMKRLADVIFTTGASTTALSVGSMTPTTGPASGGTAVTILGTGLSDTDSLRFGVSQAAFNVDGDGQLTTTSPAGSAGATVSVTVTAKSAATTAGSFTYS